MNRAVRRRPISNEEYQRLTPQQRIALGLDEDNAGAPADFGGTVLPNPNHVRPVADTDSGVPPTRLSHGVSFQHGNFRGKMPGDISNPSSSQLIAPEMRTVAATSQGQPVSTLPPQTVPVFAPDGTLGDIPQERLVDAIKAGYKPGVTMRTSDGKPGVVPADRVHDASTSGMQIVPLEEQENQHPGFWKTFGSDLYGMAKGLPGMLAPAGVTPTGEFTTGGAGQVAQQVSATAVADQERTTRGEGASYRAAAALAQGVGVNVPGMEESARQGDVAGVAGHAAAPMAVAVAPLAAEGMGAVSRMPAMADLKAAAIRSASSPTGQAVVAAAKKLPVAAIRRIPYVGDVAADVYKAAQNARPLDATKENVPYAGEEYPAAPSAAQAPATPAPDTSPKAVEQQINNSLGGKPLQKNVPLRQQIPSLQKNAPPAAATGQPATSLPEGFTPVTSSALRGYKYNPAAREFESVTNTGQHYIHGDVSPEEAQAFADAESKGKAWNQLRSQSPLVGKVVNGNRVASAPPKPMRSVVFDPETGKPEFSDVLAAKQTSGNTIPRDAAGKAIRYVYRARDVGEEGVPLTKEHASATSDPNQAIKYAEAGQRSPEPGQVVRIDLSKLSPKDYVVQQHPDGAFWVQFTRPLTETDVEHFAGAGKSTGK